MKGASSVTQSISVLRLDGAHTTMVFAWHDGDDSSMPSMIYHGERLDQKIDLEVVVACHGRPLTHATLDDNQPISLHPELGKGFLGHPALIAHRKGETALGWAGQFSVSEVIRKADGVCFVCADGQRGMQLSLFITLDRETDVATMQAELVNTGTDDVLVDWFAAPVMSTPQQYSQHLAFHGRWCAEFAIDRQAIPVGLTTRENRSGRTSHESFPGTILLNAMTNESNGQCLAMHLGWSGNHRMVLERLANGDVQVQFGALLFPGEGALKPGAKRSTPELFVAHSAHGLNALSQKLHDHVRRRILAFPDAHKPRPVTVNTWEAIYFNHEEGALRDLIDRAAEVGAERFVIDDGWFIGRNDDTTSLGDWFADPAKYPQGLKPIADYVRSKGLEFGLWVEPEMVNPKSQLFEQHPDWVLGLGGYNKILGRNQYVLDISRREVSDYLFERLSTLVEENDIAYFKWDMNRALVTAGDPMGAPVVHMQTSALYALLDRLRRAFPALEIESCASGGGRVDYEILKRTHRFWTSDSNDAVERMRIQTGFSYFLPPEVMGAHVGPVWCHTSGRGFHIDFRTLVASYGHMGVEADLRTMSDEDRAFLRQAIARHKQDREIWHKGRFYRLRTVDDDLLGAAAVAMDQSAARLIMAQIDRPRATIPPRIRLRGLDPEAHYRVRIQTMTKHTEYANRRFDNPLKGEGYTMKGSAILNAGIGLPALYAQTGLAIALDRVETET